MFITAFFFYLFFFLLPAQHVLPLHACGSCSAAGSRFKRHNHRWRMTAAGYCVYLFVFRNQSDGCCLCVAGRWDGSHRTSLLFLDFFPPFFGTFVLLLLSQHASSRGDIKRSEMTGCTAKFVGRSDIAAIDWSLSVTAAGNSDKLLRNNLLYHPCQQKQTKCQKPPS